MEKYDVFISHSRTDTMLASVISDMLKTEGVNCFRDDSMPIGSNYADAIQSAIISSKYFIFIYRGDSSENSISQRRELDLAIAGNKKVISVVLESSPDGNVRSILMKKSDCIDYSRGNLPSAETIAGELRRKILSENKCYAKSGSWKKTVSILSVLCFLILLYFGVNIFMSSPLPSPPVSKHIKSDYEEIIDQKTEKKETLLQEYFEIIREVNDSLIGDMGNITPIQKTEKKEAIQKYIENSEKVQDLLRQMEHIDKQIDSIYIANGVAKPDEVFNLDDFDIGDSSSHNDEMADSEERDDVWSNGIVILLLGITLSVGIMLGMVILKLTQKREIKFKCFIAGSIALSAERDALRSVLAEMYNQWEADRFRICSYTFEDFNREVVVGGQQILYDKFIEKNADWVVFIISNGIGEKTLNEYRIAMKSFAEHGHPKILFLAHSDASDDQTVSDIKNEIIASEQYWNTCNNIEHMKSIFYKCVNWDVTLLSKTRK